MVGQRLMVATSVLIAWGFCEFDAAAAAPRKSIVIISGAPSHPSGQHEFYAGAKLLERALQQSGLPLDVTVFKHTWPQDDRVLDKADAIVLYSDGRGRHVSNGHLDRIEELMQRGKGLMCMHYAVEVDNNARRHFTRWIGGYYEGGFSVNPHWNARMKTNIDHDTARGVAPALVHDEWYFNIRFPKDAVPTAFLTATPTPAKITRFIHWNPAGDRALNTKQALMWGIERKDGGRGVGFTGGHWHYNWANEDFRRLVLNGMAWTAKLPIPDHGVNSKPVTAAQLNENLDPKKNMVKVQYPRMPVPQDPVRSKNPGTRLPK